MRAEAQKGKQVQWRSECWWVIWEPLGGGDAELTVGTVKGQGWWVLQAEAARSRCEDLAAETEMFQEQWEVPQRVVPESQCRGTDSDHRA